MKFFSSLIVVAIASALAGAPVSVCASEKTESSKSEKVDMTPEQRKELGSFFELRAAARTQFDKARREMGEAEFKKSVDSNLQKFKSEMGSVRLTLIDGEVVERVRPAQSEKVFVIVDKNKVDKVSSHLLQMYIPRQHIDGGSSRIDGQRGRDVVLVWSDGHKEVSVEEKPRPPRMSLQWWKEYAQATYKAPTKKDVYFGLFSASVQVAFAAGVSQAKVALDPSAGFLTAPLLMNAIFGSVIGTYSATYVNWVYRGGTKADSPTKIRLKQIAKSSVVSVLYAYTLVMATAGGIDSVSFMSLAGLQNHLHVWTNIFFNNMAKVEFAQWAKVLEKKRVDGKEINIRIPFTNTVWKTGIKQRQVNFQIFAYSPVNALRTADLIGVSFSGIPLGKILLWTSVPFTKYATLKWAEKYHPQQAKELRLREEWESLKRAPLRATKAIVKAPITVSKAIYKGAVTVKEQFDASRRLLQGWDIQELYKFSKAESDAKLSPISTVEKVEENLSANIRARMCRQSLLGI